MNPATRLQPPRQAVFLDKDGTLIRDLPYNPDPGRVQLLPRVAESLRRLRSAGYALVVVTNQAGIARGLLSEEIVRLLAGRIAGLLAQEGVALDGFYYCPHHPQGGVAAYAVDCRCRKPLPGLLLRAARDLHLDIPRSWMVGDILDDVEAGHRAGCRSLLIDNGNETEWRLSGRRRPDHRTADVAGAVDFILESTKPDVRPTSMPSERFLERCQLARRARGGGSGGSAAGGGDANPTD